MLSSIKNFKLQKFFFFYHIDNGEGILLLGMNSNFKASWELTCEAELAGAVCLNLFFFTTLQLPCHTPQHMAMIASMKILHDLLNIFILLINLFIYTNKRLCHSQKKKKKLL